MKKDGNMRQTSFRDPSGFVFRENGVLYRQVNKAYADNYDLLMQSGLYKELTDRRLLIPHKEVKAEHAGQDAYKIIQPELVDFISYPYEWSFSQLKDAALLTLKIQKIAGRYGMCLKDASAYNIQFKNGHPVLIDTLSFEKYREGSPWVAYRQFCQHFLAPLALMSFADVRLIQLSRIYIDGIPLDLASALLPWRSWFNQAIFFHIHMHAKSQKRFSESKVSAVSKSFDRNALNGVLESLWSGILKIEWKPEGTEWGEYYGNTNYSSSATQGKMRLVEQLIAASKPDSVWDLGANDGLYSRLAGNRGIETVAFDIDPAAVENNYRVMKEKNETHMLPLVLDLTNPSPSLGWANKERSSLAERGPVDLAMALALIHHLSITNNVPFAMSAEFFASICKKLVIEFVPKDDSQVQRLLKNRADIFVSYNREEFEKAFGAYFRTVEIHDVPESKRTLYLMEKK